MRPDARPSTVGASFLEEDATGWLVTFSDLVLQLFAFVLVAAVLGGGGFGPAAEPVRTPARVEQRIETAEQPVADALTLARFDEPAPAVDAVPAPARPAPRLVSAASAPVDPAPAVAAFPAAPPERSLAADLEAFVAAEGLEDAVHVAVNGGGVILSISDTIGFASGSAELLPDAGAVLAAVHELVAVRPDLLIEVSGHTDDRPLHAGPFASNLELSLARAARVARALAADDPALTGHIFAAGYGAARPLAANDGAESRARNRRVELRLVPGGDAALEAAVASR